MAVATRELETIRRTADLSDVISLLRTLVEVAPRLERALGMVDALSDLADDIMPLTSDVMALTSDRLAVAQQKGYFEFAKAGLGIVDRVVAGFSEDDVEPLGDNVVTILNTVKEITQPEMLVLLQRMVDAVQRQQYVIEDEAAEPPSLWALAKKMRDPDVRRGINRALTTLGSVSAETGPETMTYIHTDNERRRRLMAVATIANHEVQIDDEGFMTNYDEWDEEVGAALAAQIGIEMTDDHWRVVKFLREDFKDQGETATIRRVSTVGGVPTKELFMLFPKKPAKKMSYIAGLPKPKGCV